MVVDFLSHFLGVVAGKPEGSEETSSSSAGSHVAGPKRELQKARKETQEDDSSVFKAFTGSSNRIDGKQVSKASSETKESKEDIAAKRLAAMSGGSSNSGGGSGSSDSSNTATPASPPIVRQSRIGDKYAKKKTAVSAFTGSANKLG